jgi:hypothetical protein
MVLYVPGFCEEASVHGSPIPQHLIDRVSVKICNKCKEWAYLNLALSHRSGGSSTPGAVVAHAEECAGALFSSRGCIPGEYRAQRIDIVVSFLKERS